MPNETAQRNLIVEEEAGLVTITMNRPEKRNALSTAMMTELTAELRAIGKRADARAVIIAGNGPAFSAGHDLGELKGRDLAFYRYEFDLCAQLMQTIQAIPQPVIARVHAIATAAGCQLAAACDLVVAGGCADARGRTKACDGNAADGAARQCAHGGGLGTREPGDGRRGAGCGNAQAGGADSRGEPANHRDRQAGVLRADRSRYGQRVRLHEGSDEPECDGVGRAGRHRRISGKAQARLVREVRPTGKEKFIPPVVVR